MGLERLSSVFNNLEENRRDDTVSDNLFNHTFGSNYAHEDIIEITPIVNAQSPSPLMAIMGTEDTIVNGHSPDSIRVNYQGSLLQTNVDISTQMKKYDLTSEVNLQNRNSVEIRSNRVNVSDITGKQLGDGNFTLESIYDPTHGGNYSERRPTYEGEAGGLLSDLLLHTAGKDIGSTTHLNIRSTKGYGGRFGNFSKVNEPYIVKPIGAVGRNEKASGYDRDFIPYNAAKDDASRLVNYYLSPDGLAFIAKENITNIAVGDGLTLGEPFRSIMLPPLPVPMTGLLNFYQQRAQENFPQIGGFDAFKKSIPTFVNSRSNLSNRKPGRKNYSDMVNTLTPVTLKLQGDIPKEFIHQQKNPLEKLLGVYDGIDFRFEKDQDKRAMSSEESTGLQKGSAAGKWTGKTIGNMFLGTVDFVGKALHGAKELAVKTTIDALGPLVSVPHLKNPTQKFLDLNPAGSAGITIPGAGPDGSDLKIGGGMTRYDDVVSKADISKQPLEESTVGKPEAGDFYLRINDLRNGQFMYFRGYVTGITENVTPSWNPVTYIGRSEDVWTYSKAERDLSFNLRLAPQNLTEFTMMYKKINKLTSLAYPKYLPEAKGALRMQGPFTELYLAHIGSRTVGQFGYIKSLTYTVNEQGDWDVISNRARVIDVAISYQILGRRPPSYNTKFYTPATVAEIDQYEYPDAYLEDGNPGEMFA